MKRITFSFLNSFKAVSILAIALVISTANAQSSYTVQFQDESIAIPENISTFDWNQMPESSKLNDRYYGWVQFYQTPIQDIQDLFKSSGLELIEYIPHKTYLFSFPESTSITMLENNGVRGIIPVPGSVKLSTALKNPPYESYAVEGNNIIVTLQHYKTVNTQFVISELARKQIGVVHQFDNSNILELSIPNNCLADLSSLPYVKWVELISPPAVKDDIKGRGLHRANGLDTQTSAGRNYTGEGIGVLVRDDGRVGPHIDFEGRLVNQTSVSGQSHGDGVAGIMTGAGNLDPMNRGMAAGANVWAVNYASNFLDSTTLNLMNSGDVQITNSSYSNGCNAGYTTITQTVDTQMNDYPSVLHVFSAGNSNGSNCGYGAGTQWGNITGGHKQGKNVIATANTNFAGLLTFSSSRGPAHDGRIKPDIAANGTNQVSTNENNTYQTFGGTSAAAPGIAGVSAQLYQLYSEANSGALPPAALIKATLMNTANDAGNVGPDFKFGWGIVNGLRAGKLLEDERYLSDQVSQGGTNNHTINVPSGTKEVRFMVYWSDPAAAVNADPALVNDLDLVVTDPGSTSYLPYLLDHTPNTVNLNLPATNGADHLNNVEQVLIDSPSAGNYDIEISGFNVPVGPQEYFIVYEIISENLTLTYPNGGEFLHPGTNESIHWDKVGLTSDITLEYSTNNGGTWTEINTFPNTVITYQWAVPADTGGNALVRVRSGSFQDESDAPFNIAAYPTGLAVTEVCPLQATFTWDAVPGAESYDFYILGEKFMEVVGNSTTNEITVPITDSAAPIWFSVSAKNATDGWESRRTIAENHPGGEFGCTLAIDENIFSDAISLYPNPSNNTVNISMNSISVSSLEVSLVNSLGQILHRSNYETVNSNNEISIDVSGYAAGLYFISFNSEGVTTTKKLLVM
ncbi:S8 family serine peptidase [Ulvibacter antarcticus]|uniref:Putative secreted protein (Por secretion system target) n=1 Tax=Ulvibacter antarcticus TaxID=442714 RepID=A0A3L9Z1E4_9FLAO|nr:S8 family serine peptidase [Ulvibacter antarcticus]RMA65940.1 putative secreted protein (Por secretion system target) [Ulvibacter antarcticus]